MTRTRKLATLAILSAATLVAGLVVWQQGRKATVDDRFLATLTGMPDPGMSGLEVAGLVVLGIGAALALVALVAWAVTPSRPPAAAPAHEREQA